MSRKSKVTVATLATVICALVVATGSGATSQAQTTQYPWVQLPAWVGTGLPAVATPVTSAQWVQPPAWIPI